MVFKKVFGALKEMTGYDLHGMVKQGALKNPITYNILEQGVGLAKKIPGLSAFTGGISDFLLDIAKDYMKKTREEVQNIQNPDAKKVLQSEFKQVQLQPQHISEQQQNNTPTNQGQQVPIYHSSINNASKGIRARNRALFKHKNRPR